MKTMKDYQDLYLKCNISLVANVFEKFRNNSLTNYGLCPRHYLSSPGLSWDAAHEMLKIKLEHILDLDMYIFFKKGTKEISYISNRDSKTNNKYVKSDDPKQKTKYIIYLDAKGLYGYEMAKFFLTSRFKGIYHKKLDLNEHTSNSSKACVLKVDLKYSKQLQELHNGYPLAPGKIEIKREMLSEY